MPREKGRRGNKMPFCLTCLISCLVVIVVLVVGLIIGANVAFNKYVSPQIGGVTLSECNKLLRGIFKAKRDKIVTDEYTAQDLDDFYKSLNAVLYQKDKTQEELREEYDALSDEEKAKTDFETYSSAHKYRITVDTLLEAVNLSELTAQNQNQDQELAAAEDEGTQTDENLTKLFKQLSFDFSKLKDYPYQQDTEDTSYTTFELEPNHVAALIGELLPKIINNVDMSSTPLGDANIADFVKLPQIRTYYSLPEGAENRDKSLKLDMTVELFVREMVQGLVAPLLEEQGISSAVVGFVKKLLPKNIYVTLAVMPLDENAEIDVKINNYDQKQADNLKKIVNALTSNSDFSIFPSSEEKEEDQSEVSEQDTQSKNIFLQVNQKVCEVFVKINDYAPVQFVPKGESATLRAAHIQALLSLMKMYDPADLENSVTPHMFLTTLRCLFDVSASSSNAEALDGLYSQLQSNYGIDKEFWNGRSLFAEDTLSELPKQIDMPSVTFKDNEQMRVYLTQGQLTTLLTDAFKNGTLNTDSDVAAAEDEGSSLSDALTFDRITIEKKLSGNVSNYVYVDSSNNEKTIQEGTYTVYYINLKASLSIIDLLAQGESSDLLSVLSNALPEKFTLAINLKIKDYFDKNGEIVTRVIGGEAGTTSLEINNFDEVYTEKVINVFKLMIAKLSSSEPFDATNIVETIESSITKVFDTLRENLYCTITLSDKDQDGYNTGCLVLPSIYELVRGFTTMRINSSETLTQDDNLTINELKDVFSTLYNTPIAVVENGESIDDPTAYYKVIRKYDENAVDDFLQEFSDKYYLNEKITKEKIFGDSDEGLENLVTIDNINFKGKIKNGVLVKGLYTDLDKTLNDLRVNMTGDQLCSLINSSGNLNQDSVDSDVIKSFEILNCEGSWIDDVLYLDLELKAATSIDDSSSDSEIDINSFLPSDIFITARILLYADAYDDYSRFDVNVLINGKSSDNLIKLINIFVENGFDTAELSNTVADSIKTAFENIENNVNLVFDQTNDAIFQIDNVFNTINKTSHKNNSAYSSDWADDALLKTEIQEFGREPVYSSNDVTYNSDVVNVINRVDILKKYFDEGISDSNIYSPYDSDYFLDDVNSNYYIKTANRLTVDSIKNLKSVSSDIVDFKSIFDDDTPYDQLKTYLTNNRFTALANNFFDGGIEISDGSGGKMGTAKVIQTRIYNDRLELVVFFATSFTDEDDESKVLPDYFFITTYTDLTEDSLGIKNYDTEVIINSLSDYTLTQDLFQRIKLLNDSLGLPMDVSLDEITDTITDNVKDIFDNYLQMFGEIEISESQIKIPNLFEYLVNGKLENDGEGNGIYNKDDKMTDQDGTLTNPEVFRLRLQELGKKDDLFISSTDTRMVVWYNGKPYDHNEDLSIPMVYRNANTFLNSDSDDFFAQIKSLYFLKDTPDENSFNTIYDSLSSGNLSDKFNLTGISASLISNPTTRAEIMNNYDHFGLYNYLESQLDPVLSDKAMGALIKKRNSIDLSTISSVENIDVTSVTLNVLSTTKQTIEITIKVYTKNTEYMPEYFYVTSNTTREKSSTGYDYSTTITINRFENQDFEDFKANIDHLSTFEISSELNYDSITQKINEAISKFFDDTLGDYINYYGEFSDQEKQAGAGVGYIDLKNIYSILVDKTTTQSGVNRAKLNAIQNDTAINATSKAFIIENSETIMQNIIVKLRNVNSDLLDNKLTDVERIDRASQYLTLTNVYQDKDLAVGLDMLISDVNVCQAVIFTNTNSHYDAYENILLASSNKSLSSPFEGFVDKPYILVTANINTNSSSGVNTGIDFLPDNIYGSVLFAENNDVLGIFFNDFTYEETEFFKLISSDDNGNLDIETKLKQALENFKGNKNWSYSQSDDFDVYYGKLTWN